MVLLASGMILPCTEKMISQTDQYLVISFSKTYVSEDKMTKYFVSLTDYLFQYGFIGFLT